LVLELKKNGLPLAGSPMNRRRTDWLVVCSAVIEVSPQIQQIAVGGAVIPADMGEPGEDKIAAVKHPQDSDPPEILR